MLVGPDHKKPFSTFSLLLKNIHLGITGEKNTFKKEDIIGHLKKDGWIGAGS